MIDELAKAVMRSDKASRNGVTFPLGGLIPARGLDGHLRGPLLFDDDFRLIVVAGVPLDAPVVDQAGAAGSLQQRRLAVLGQRTARKRPRYELADDSRIDMDSARIVRDRQRRFRNGFGGWRLAGQRVLGRLAAGIAIGGISVQPLGRTIRASGPLLRPEPAIGRSFSRTKRCASVA